MKSNNASKVYNTNHLVFGYNFIHLICGIIFKHFIILGRDCRFCKNFISFES